MKTGDLIETVHAQFERADLYYGHGTDNAWDEAVALVLGITGFADHDSVLKNPVSEAVVRKVLGLAERRERERIPLPYLLGRCHFAGYEFLVASGVIIPRSPIAELVRNHFRPWLTKDPLRVLDLCCGGGCIGIATALEFSHAQVVLADIDEAALALARANVDRHGLGERVTVVHSDLYANVQAPFDLIVTNPPYVDDSDLVSMPEEYRHEPVRALAGGKDGLDVVRRIIDEAPKFLRVGGVLIGEVGASAAALSRAYPRTPFIWVDLEEGGEGVFVLDARSS